MSTVSRFVADRQEEGVGATLGVAGVDHTDAVHHTKTGDHKGRPYGPGRM